MKRSEFYLLQNAEPSGPYTKQELERSVYMGEISLETQYSYDRARAWRPLSHLIGNVNPQIIADNLKTIFIALNDQSCGPYSYNELKDMIKRRTITHRTLFVRVGEENWEPLAKLPLPRIPESTPREGVPHERDWESQATEQIMGNY